jgi:hypothetical protein
VVGVCRAQSVAKLDAFKERMTVISWATDDRQAIRKAVATTLRAMSGRLGGQA